MDDLLQQQLLTLKLAYLQAQWSYIEAAKDVYITKLSERLNQLGKIYSRQQVKAMLGQEEELDSCDYRAEDIIDDDVDIKKLYHELMLHFHPDKNTTTTTTSDQTQDIEDCHKMAAEINSWYRDGHYSKLVELHQRLGKSTGTTTTTNLNVKTTTINTEMLAAVAELQNQIKSVTSKLYWQWHEGSADDRRVIESYYFYTEEEAKTYIKTHTERMAAENESIRLELKYLCSTNRSIIRSFLSIIGRHLERGGDALVDYQLRYQELKDRFAIMDANDDNSDSSALIELRNEADKLKTEVKSKLSDLSSLSGSKLDSLDRSDKLDSSSVSDTV